MTPWGDGETKRQTGQRKREIDRDRKTLKEREGGGVYKRES